MSAAPRRANWPPVLIEPVGVTVTASASVGVAPARVRSPVATRTPASLTGPEAVTFRTPAPLITPLASLVSAPVAICSVGAVPLVGAGTRIEPALSRLAAVRVTPPRPSTSPPASTLRLAAWMVSAALVITLPETLTASVAPPWASARLRAPAASSDPVSVIALARTVSVPSLARITPPLFSVPVTPRLPKPLSTPPLAPAVVETVPLAPRFRSPAA